MPSHSSQTSAKSTTRAAKQVTGRLTRQKAAAAGAASGAWMGLFIGLAFALFGKGNQIGFIITIVLFGAIFGLIWSQIVFAPPGASGILSSANIVW